MAAVDRVDAVEKRAEDALSRGLVERLPDQVLVNAVEDQFPAAPGMAPEAVGDSDAVLRVWREGVGQGLRLGPHAVGDDAVVVEKQHLDAHPPRSTPPFDLHAIVPQNLPLPNGVRRFGRQVEAEAPLEQRGQGQHQSCEGTCDEWNRLVREPLDSAGKGSRRGVGPHQIGAELSNLRVVAQGHVRGSEHRCTYIRADEYPSMAVARATALSAPSVFIWHLIWMRGLVKLEAEKH